MICEKCGTELPDSAKFCGKCGSKVEKEVICGSCGAIIPAGNSFCMECGTPVGTTLSTNTQKNSNTDDIKNEEDSLAAQTRAILMDAEIHKVYRNCGCGFQDKSTFGLFISSGSYLFYTFPNGYNRSVLGKSGQFDGTILEVMTDHGKKGTFFIKNEKFGKEATVDFPKVFFPSFEDDGGNGITHIKSFDVTKKTLETLKSFINPMPGYVMDIVYGIDGCFYCIFSFDYEKNGEWYSNSYLICPDKGIIIGFDNTDEYTNGCAEFLNAFNKASTLRIDAYNKRYIYLSCHSSKEEIVYDIETGKIYNIKEFLSEKHQKMNMIGIDAQFDRVLLAKDNEEWEDFHDGSICRNFITVGLWDGKEIDWHTETMADEGRKTEGWHYAAFDSDSLIYGKPQIDDPTNPEPAGVIVYDSNHNVKKEWHFNKIMERDCYGMIMCAGGRVMRLWWNDPVTGEPMPGNSNQFYVSVDFQSNNIRPQCDYGQSYFTTERKERLLELYKTI